MGLVTRFFIIEPSDRPAEPGDIEHLDTLIAAYNDWVAEHLFGHRFNPAPVKLLTSPYTIAQLAEDPEPLLNEAIIAATGDKGFWQYGMSTIAFPLGELLTGYYGANHLSPDHGCAICGDAIFYGLRGEGPPPGSPQWLIEQWPGGAWGGPIHEMIHTWGVEEHDAGIMLEHWLYPATFISPKDQAILLDSKFIQPPSPPNWLISNYTISDGAGCYHIEFDTDEMTVIEMVVSQKVPVSRRHYKVQRGLRVFCYYTWRLEDVTIVRYDTLEDTHHHDFTYCPEDPTEPIYFYFRNRFEPERKSTKTPIMSALKGPVNCWTETFPGPGFDLPWTVFSSPGLPPPQPQGGIISLYAPAPSMSQGITLLAEHCPPLNEIPMNQLYLSIFNLSSEVGGFLAETSLGVSYVNEAGDISMARTILFAHETKDCSLRDPLREPWGKAGWRAPNAFTNLNLGSLWTNPQDYCHPPLQGPMARLHSITLRAKSTPFYHAKLTCDLIRICRQDPNMTHPPYKPTHPG